MRPATGSVLFTLGIIIAISGAAKPPAPGETFPDTFPVFIAGFLAAVAGVEIWWGHRTILRLLAGDADDDAPDNPLVALGQLVPALRDFHADIDTLDAADIEERVEKISTDYIAPFVEGRQLLIDRLGLKEGSNLLVTAATGERMLNRTWSAAADGHLEEARNSCQEAVAAFEDAARIGGVAAD